MHTSGVELLPTDAELDELAASGRLWALLEACENRLLDEPAAARARVYRGAALAGLGVGELANQALDGLDDADAAAVRGANQTLPKSRIEAEHAIRVCRANLDAIGPGAAELCATFDAWSDAIRRGERRLFRCADGNVLRECDRVLSVMSDERAAAGSADLGFGAHSGDASVSQLPGVVVVANGRTPWLLERALAALGGETHGYRPRIFVVDDAGVPMVLDGLAMKDMSGPLGRASTHWIVGSNAAERLQAELAGLWEWKLPGGVIATQACPEIVRAVESALREQQEKYRSLTATIEGDGRPTARDQWKRRFDEACNGGAEPLHVLLPTTRYSSFVRRAMEDLAGAIRRSGHTATVAVEPTDDLRPAATFELRAHAELRPDLTISANWPRATRPNAWPAGAPGVCWVQDMLGHLLDPRLGAAQGELDFMSGLVSGALIRDFGYVKARSLFLATPACPVKFHDGPLLMPGERVDVAYVSHQSESPRAMLERLNTRAGSDAERALIDRIAGEVERLMSGAWAGKAGQAVTYQRFSEITEACVSDAIGRSDEATTSRLLMMLTLPLAERIHRHTMIEWAAAVCARHGLVLGLFGNGWEQTRFSAHARGAIGHDESLRSCYQRAGCHLHASLATNAHQRIFECALSGGLMLRRGPSPDWPAILQTQRCILAMREPDYEHRGYQGYRIGAADGPREPDAGVYDAVRLLGVVGPEAMNPFEFRDERKHDAWADRGPSLEVKRWLPDLPLEQFPDWSFDRASETLFRNAEELEQMILRAVNDEHWRRETIAHHHGRVSSFNTTDVHWQRLLASVRAGLAAGSR